MMRISHDKARGMLLGGAYGDALGRPTEFMKIAEIRRRFGATGALDLPANGQITDDTQMTLRVARAVLAERPLIVGLLAGRIGAEFVLWALREPPRAPGVTCMRAVKSIALGDRWQDATVAESKGCGANMRVAPAAFLPDDEWAGAAQLQAAVTHGHPTALAASELTAYALRLAAADCPLDRLPGKLLAYVDERIARGDLYEAAWLGRLQDRWATKWPTGRTAMLHGWTECRNTLAGLAELLRSYDSTNVALDPCSFLGGGWAAEEALVLALYFAAQTERTTTATTAERTRQLAAFWLSQAARTDGDSDSVASIAGQLIGARFGDVWPRGWSRRIERGPEIEQTARLLAEIV